MIRYYPPSKTIDNLTASKGQFTDSNGKQYIGKYYKTFDGKYFSGPNPWTGPNEPLQEIPVYYNVPNIDSLNLSRSQKIELLEKTNVQPRGSGEGKPSSYYARPTQQDYDRGYITRYFVKKENETIITEISNDEYTEIVNGTVRYDVSMYQTTKILWKLTGPLRSQRKSQYNVIPGIIDTNQRLTEAAAKTFLGIVEYIGGEYATFARPTP